MKFRLGYVAMTLNLVDCSPSGTVTVAAFNKLADNQAAMGKVRRIAVKNLENTLRILRYNLAYNIDVYRFTSKLIPLATHPVLDNWNYSSDLKEQFRQIGDFVKENDMRVSAHPDHYTLINSGKPEVVEESIKDLDYHVNIYEAMGLGDYRYKLVMHVGGLYKDKETSIERFKNNFILLPDRIRKRIILENDDKSYSVKDVLGICKELNIPMVLDVHHHNCNNNGESLANYLPEVFDTWKGQYFNPKIHFSSPKCDKEFRNHSDFINSESFVDFLKVARELGIDFDVMLEAKMKDNALFKLADELKTIDWLVQKNESEFEL